MGQISLFFITLLTFLMAPQYETSFAEKINKKHTKDLNSADKKMYTATMQMRGSYYYISPQYVLRLIKEINEVTSEPKNSWMSPQDLLGLVMGESDLRWWIVTGKDGMWDCGIGQNHTPLFRRTYQGRRKLCKQLTKSTKLSLEHTMKELNTIRNSWCLKRYKRLKKKNKVAWKYKQYRCNFNIYNQGPRFLTRKSCWVRYKNKGYTTKKYRQRLNKCLYINRYWLRTYCFIRGAELGYKPTKSCRRASSLKWINRVYKRR